MLLAKRHIVSTFPEYRKEVLDKMTTYLTASEKANGPVLTDGVALYIKFRFFFFRRRLNPTSEVIGWLGVP